MNVAELRVRGELARSHIYDHRLTRRTDTLVSLMGSSVVGEVDDISILRTGLSNGYWDPLDRLPAPRLLPRAAGWSEATLCSGPSRQIACRTISVFL